MAALFLLGLAVGLDNLFVGLSLGTLRPTSQRRWQLALGFGLFEGGMPVIGLLVGRELATRLAVPWLGPVLLAATAALILAGALHGDAVAHRAGRSAGLLLLPPLLSIDNLVAGGALGAFGTPLPAALLLVGLLSAALAALGLYLGHDAVRRASVPARLLAGIALLLVIVLDLV